MAWTLRLYRDITPNEGRNTHYVFTTALDYINELESARIGAILTLDNFRINANRAEINATPTLEEIFNEITYAIVYDADTKYFRAYWVTSSVNESGMIKLTLNVDLWASSIMGARFSDMHITRCNKNVGDYVYDDIKNYNSNFTASNIQRLGITSNLNNFALVIRLAYNVDQSIFGDEQITKSEIVYINLGTFNSFVNALDGQGQYNNIDIIFKISDILGGVFGISGGNRDFNAQVLRAWIVPAVAVEVSGASVYEYAVYDVKTKSQMTVFVTKTLPTLTRILPHNYIVNYPASSYLFPNNELVNIQLTAGTPLNGVRMRRQALPVANYRFIFSNEDVKVIVADGVQEIDITNSFEITITDNNGTTTTLVRIANILGATISQGSNIVSSGIKSGAVGLGASFAGAMGTMLSSFKDATPLKALNSGNASNVYLNVADANTLLFPLAYTFVSSLEDEHEHALEFGAKFDIIAQSLATLESASFILSTMWTYNNQSKRFSREDETYVLIDQMTLDGVQENAKDYIKNEFGRGIFYKSI